MDIVNKIKRMQRESGLSSAQLAYKAGISPTTLQRMYSRGSIPRLGTLFKICSGFGITMEHFFSEDDFLPHTDMSQAELLKFFSELCEEQRHTLLVFLESIKS